MRVSDDALDEVRTRGFAVVEGWNDQSIADVGVRDASMEMTLYEEGMRRG